MTPTTQAGDNLRIWAKALDRRIASLGLAGYSGTFAVVDESVALIEAEAAAAATAREARLRNALDVAHGKLDLIATTRDRTSRGPIRDALAGMAAIERALATPEDRA
jgi:hypothetical protein